MYGRCLLTSVGFAFSCFFLKGVREKEGGGGCESTTSKKGKVISEDMIVCVFS